MTLAVHTPAPARARPVDIGRLFDAHAAELCRYVERMTGRRELAEEIVQDVFIVARRRQADLVPGSNLRAWLYQVAAHHVRHQRRGTARWLRMIERFTVRPAEGHPDGPEDAAAASSTARRIQRTVAKLPEVQREVFVLFELQEVEGADIAEILGVSVNTVWSRLRLARERFRAAWAAEEAR